MGEYHTRRGPDGQPVQLCKLGVCDDLRYVRREEALQLEPLDAGAGSNIGALLADEKTLWRFPWPDEDGAGVEQISQREMFRTVLVAAEPICSEHGERCVALRPEGVSSGWSVNVFIPCPRRCAEAGLKSSPVAPLWNIYGERWRAGRGRTILRCAWCGWPISLPEAELAHVRAALRQQAQQEEQQAQGRRVCSAAAFLSELAGRLRPALPPD